MTDTNLHARKQIARKWPSLSDDERQQLRSLWSRAGVVCEICCLVGYYREICPKQCKLPKRKIFDSDSDSDEDEQDGKGKGPSNTGGMQQGSSSSSSNMVAGYVNETGLGILWGGPNSSQTSSKKQKKNASSSLSLTSKQQHLADIRPNALAEKVTHPPCHHCYQYTLSPPDHHTLSIHPLTTLSSPTISTPSHQPLTATLSSSPFCRTRLGWRRRMPPSAPTNSSTRYCSTSNSYFLLHFLTWNLLDKVTINTTR